ncbi:MAG TPA: hypothetical protein VMG82_36575 [Candidatus Sulfotelmatobacter sp.]|nr:hypothetical protein [Candidatus Sulfotelmatobacter sp.]
MNPITLAIALLLLPVLPSDKIPVGTAIPVMLSSSLNTSKDKPDKKIEGRVMQEITLPSGIKVREGARILGHTVNVSAGSSGSTVVVKFTAIQDEDRIIPVTVGLLAVASMARVNDAKLPVSGNSDISPDTQWATRQVGGDLVRRGWGKVFSSTGVEGKWVGGASVLIKLTPNAGAGCNGGPGYDREQAVWIFSSSACGTYGLGKAKIASSGIDPPTGEITLTSSRNIDIRGGSGWLFIAAGESSQESE